MTDVAPVPVWLDVTRLVSRVGRAALTGIDRVELAWLRHLLAQDHPDTRYLLRSTRGHLLLDRPGGRLLLDMVQGAPVPERGDRLSRLFGKGSDPRHRVEGALRPLAVDRALPRGLGRLIARNARTGVVYLNTGHANQSQRTLGALADAPQVRVAVLIHDLIPILHPDLVAEGMPGRFAARLESVRQHADLVIANSEETDHDLAAHWADRGRRPPSIVAPLGIDPPRPGPGPRDPRHFVMLGTIEPRKNHALMLDVWERLAARLPDAVMPHLHIIGPTGWRVEALMQRLERHPLRGRFIHLHGPLPEAAVSDHLSRAVALLFPSLAEGYGYPPIEAALMGALPICSDLAVFRKTLGDCAVYRNVNDAYPWTETIEKHVLGKDPLPVVPPLVATPWSAHHEAVARAMLGIVRKGRE